ncbi:MAG: host-nuclease inhibitor Gam family protein [Syntrophobacteraceae bacterium]
MRSVRDWNDVDRALEEMGLLDLGISERTSALGRKLHELLGEYSGELTDLTGKRRGIESAVQLFCLLNKCEFAKKRSKLFHHGRIAFRMAERIDVAEELQAAAIATLKKLGRADCIEIRERLDKAALKKLSDTDLARCGIKRTREDHFRIEPDLNLISEKIGKNDLAAPAFAVDVEKLAKLVVRKDGEGECGGTARDVSPLDPEVVAASRAEGRP